MQPAAKRGKTCNQLSSTGKHATSCRAREKKRNQLLSVGKHATSCQARENIQATAKREKRCNHLLSAQKRDDILICGDW